MSEHTSRLLSLIEPALAPLRRADLASFLVSIPDGKVLMATPPCAALGIEADLPAPMGAKIVARRVAASGNGSARLERVRLPSAFVPRVFSCATVNSPLGRLVIFADPRALIPGDAPVGAPTATLYAVEPVAAETSRPVRFTWEADAQGRFSALSRSIVDALGPRLRAWQGRTFGDLASDGVLKDVAAIVDLLSAGASFSDAVLWTGEDPPRRIEIGGVPLFDGAKRRIGVRGFGIIWEAPPRPVNQAPEPPRNVVPLRGGALNAKERSAFHEIARTLNEAIDGWPKPPAEPLSAGPPAPAAPPASPTPLQAPAHIEAPPPSPAPPPAAPVAAAPVAAPPASPVVAPPIASLPAAPPPSASSPAAPPPTRGVDEILLDRLPIGLAIQQRGELVHVNATLLAWAGVPDAETFRLSGGLSARLARQTPDGPLLLETPGSSGLPMEVRLVSASWRGQSAIVHVLREIPPPSSPPPLPEAVPPPRLEVDVGAIQTKARSEALDVIPFGVFLLDRAGAIDELNAAAAELCGFRGDELQGEPFTLLFASESQTAAVSLLDRASEAKPGDAAGQATLMLRHRLGIETLMEAALIRAFDMPPRFCLVLRPPSAAETALRRLPPEPSPQLAKRPAAPWAVQAEEEAAVAEAMEPFVRRVSHAVRVPLTSILGFVDAVRSSTFGPVGNSRYSKQAEAAVAAGQQLLASLEDIEQLIPAAFEDGREAINVDTLLKDALDHVAPSARRRRILIRQETAPPPLEVWFNAPALARIVRMLLEEALRATPAGGQIVISTRKRGMVPGDEGIIIMIRDGGMGLTEEEIAQALSPVRAASASDRFSTAGLPFRMSRIAVVMKANGGELRLRRGVDSGMLCEIHLPA